MAFCPCLQTWTNRSAFPPRLWTTATSALLGPWLQTSMYLHHQLSWVSCLLTHLWISGLTNLLILVSHFLTINISICKISLCNNNNTFLSYLYYLSPISSTFPETLIHICKKVFILFLLKKEIKKRWYCMSILP